MPEPRLERSTERLAGGGIRVRWSALFAFNADGGIDLDDFGLGELADLAGVPADDGLRDGASARILANGWQSWSAGWELQRGERVPRVRVATTLNRYNERPLPPRRDGRDEAQFIGWLRSGADDSGGFLVLAATGRDAPPLTYRLDRQRGRLGVEALASGASYEAGDAIAELSAFWRPDFFGARDGLRELFGFAQRTEPLAFLGQTGAERLVPGGYESWYNHYERIDEGLLRADLEAIGANENLLNTYYIQRGKPTVFQIDDGWESMVGDWTPHAERFPRGMAALASDIEARGYIPGLWLAPFALLRDAPIARSNPEWILKDARDRPAIAGWQPSWRGDWYALDLSLPEVLDYLEATMDRVINEWGYRYLKLDFLFAGMHPGVHARPDAHHRIYRRALERLTRIERRRDGKPVAYLGCGAPLGLSWERLPLMRVGADTLAAWDDAQTRFIRHQGRPSAWINLRDSIGRCLLDGSVFVNDPDVVFCRTENMRLTRTEKELVALVAFLFASQIMFSDDPHAFDESEERDFTRHIVRLFDALAGKECVALRVAGARDAYRVSSRDGSIRGLANLGDTDRVLPDVSGGAPAIVLHARPAHPGALRYERRSITLFGAQP